MEQAKKGRGRGRPPGPPLSTPERIKKAREKNRRSSQKHRDKKKAERQRQQPPQQTPARPIFEHYQPPALPGSQDLVVDAWVNINVDPSLHVPHINVVPEVPATGPLRHRITGELFSTTRPGATLPIKGVANMGLHETKAQAFYGAVIHTLSTPGHDLEILPSALLIIESQGVITSFHKDVKPGEIESLIDTTTTTLHRLSPSQFLIPGFIDTHNHAPQWAQRGLGQGQHILDWLSAITFPNEGRFRDPSHAQRIYSSAIDGFLRQGITTASYYGSIHPEATNILADLCLAKGQRAFVGKCNMTRNSPDYYRDASIEQSLQDTESCIAHIRKIDPEGKLLKHVLTPRFAISCDAECLAGLGQIAAKNPDLPIQTHFNEAEQEITATRELFPQFESEADLYDHYGLLTKRSILAHCCYMTTYEFDKLKELQCGVAHCPISNMTVGGGFMAAPIREFLNRGIKVGLGTDSGGGFSSSMLDAIRQAMIASHAREVESKGRDKGLKIAEAFYLATLGGAEVCCLEDKVGNFEVGKEFDALVVDWERDGVMTMVEKEDGLGTVFEKFVMTGDDRNIVRVFVKGRVVREVRI